MFSSPMCFHALTLPPTHRQQQSGDQVEEELQDSTMAGEWVEGDGRGGERCFVLVEEKEQSASS